MPEWPLPLVVGVLLLAVSGLLIVSGSLQNCTSSAPDCNGAATFLVFGVVLLPIAVLVTVWGYRVLRPPRRGPWDGSMGNSDLPLASPGIEYSMYNPEVLQGARRPPSRPPP